jgi:hypothetical protein
MLDLSDFKYYNGCAPQIENEVIVTPDAINILGISYELIQSITIDIINSKLWGSSSRIMLIGLG